MDTAALPPVILLPQPKPSKKKRSFTELLSSGRHADKENISDNLAGSKTSSGAGLAAGIAATAGAVSVVHADAVLSTAGTSSTVSNAKPPKPAKLVQKSRCGQCKSCLKPKNKQACLVLAAERAALSQVSSDPEIASTTV